VDQEALPVATLAGTLYRKFEGRHAIVVGGGPSAPRQYAEVISALDNPLVISANGHAAKLGLKPDFIVCKDHRHTETRELMEPGLRALGAPIVSRNYWADYRLTGWPIQGNSGMQALGFAVMLGCRPVVPIGFDCYQNGTYFHDPLAKNVSLGLRPSMWDSRYQKFARRLEGAPIRPLEGQLCKVYPRFNPVEQYAQPHMPVALRAYETVRVAWVRARHPFMLRGEKQIQVPAGYVLPVDEEELLHARRGGHVEILDSEPRPMVSSCAQATAAEGSPPSPLG
jgi:hypothetical protein